MTRARDAATNSHVATFVHPTGEGNQHVPAGGATGQSLVYASAGTAAWGSAGAPFAGTVATLTASGTLTNNQKGYQILINGSGVMVTLPSSTIGMYYVISNAGNAAFQILGTSNQPVGGANSPKKIEIGGSVIVAATGNGTGWTITGVNSDGGVLATTYDVTAGSYTHNVAPNTACLLVCAWGATAAAHKWFKNYVYTVGGTGGGNYAEKFITSPASSYAVVIGATSSAGGSANDTTVAGMTLAGGPPKPGGGNNNSANGPVFPPAAMPTGGDYAARGGNGSLYSGNITGGGGGSASRGGTGGNAGTILQGTAGTCWSFGGGGTGGNDAPTTQYTGSESTQGAAYTTRNASAYNLTNLGVINEVGSGGIVATSHTGGNNAGKGASSLATLTLGGSQTVNIVIGSASAGRGSAGAWQSGHNSGSDAGCVTFVEFTEAV
jgi:hypothetical protein